MAGVSKGQFSTTTILCICCACRDDGELRRRLEKKGGGFAFKNSPNTKKRSTKKFFSRHLEKTKKSDFISHRTQK